MNDERLREMQEMLESAALERPAQAWIDAVRDLFNAYIFDRAFWAGVRAANESLHADLGQAKRERDELLARVSELEDTIRMRRAEDWAHSSYGRDGVANSILADIAARRGEDWTGAPLEMDPDGKHRKGQP